jgi:hypothetical protein
MKDDQAKSVHASAEGRTTTDLPMDQSRSAGNTRVGRHSIYQAAWYVVNSLLVVAIVLAIYSAGWEYSTRRYLKGFSDAIVPATSPPDEKVEAIVQWIAHGPARLRGDPSGIAAQNRNPTDTLNYEALLQVCGTATNAFINLVDSGGLAARRLLLLDSRQMTTHVTAEVLVDGRWIVVDPAYRTVLREPGGKPLTRDELMNPETLAVATRNIPRYDPKFTYDHVAHIRLSRFRFIGPPLGALLDRVLPGWEDSTIITLFLERKSFAAMVLAIFVATFLMLLRLGMRFYGERRLGIRRRRVREQLIQACNTFLRAPN